MAVFNSVYCYLIVIFLQYTLTGACMSPTQALAYNLMQEIDGDNPDWSKHWVSMPVCMCVIRISCSTDSSISSSSSSSTNTINRSN